VAESSTGARAGSRSLSHLQQIATTCGRAFGIAEADKPARFSQCITGQALWRIEPFKVWVGLQVSRR